MSSEFDTDKWREEKQKEKNDTYEKLDDETQNIVSDVNEFKKYLNVQSQFLNQFNVANSLLITSQMPQATLLRDAETWFSNNARLNSKPKSVVLLEQNGTYVNEEGDISNSYSTKKYYDISQVKTREKPNKIKYNNKFLYQAILNGFANDNINVQFKIVENVDRLPEIDQIAKYDERENKFYIALGSSIPQNEDIKCIVEEMVKYKFLEQGKVDNFKVQCATYMICKRYDIIADTPNDIPFTMKNCELQTIRQELKSTLETSKELNSEIAKEIAITIRNREQTKNKKTKER